MAGYRRFIAYVYEYSNGKKGEGRGFIKVEARDGICRMSYKLTGIYGKPSVPAKIYGYVRGENGCQGIWLGSCDLGEGQLQFEKEMPEEDLGGSGYSLEKICGLILLGDKGELYASGWDDKPVDLDRIELPSRGGGSWEKEERKEEAKDRAEEEKEAEEEEREEPSEEEREAEGPPEEEQEAEEPMEEDEEAEEPEKGLGWEGERGPKGEAQRELPEPEPKSGEEGPKKQELREPETEKGPEAEIETESWEEETFLPFADGEIGECRKLTLREFGRLGRRDRGLAGNPFLRHGFSGYGHLLLGRRQEDGRCILGVPGVYERQEGLMANMFGFPFFKEAGTRRKGERRFGYWYRLIDTPDFYGGNGR